MNHDVLLNQQRTLNTIELALKAIAKKHTKRTLYLPQELSAITDIFEDFSSYVDSNIVDKIIQANLKENSFFQNGADVALYRHLRYLPVYWHSHSFIEIVCVFEGTCTNYIHDKEIQMIPGDICIISPHTPHCISAFSDDCIIINIELRVSTFETAFFGVLTENDVLADFFTHILYHSPKHSYIYFRTNGDKELFDYILYAYDETLRNHRYKNRMINNVIMAFFTILLRNHESEVLLPDTDSKELSENVLFILRYIQVHYNTITLPDLAEFFNYSERQIQRILKKNTGYSFRELIQKQKMKQASNLLLHSELPVSSISEKLGYSDVGNFRQIFRNYYGVNPSEYRQGSHLL